MNISRRHWTQTLLTLLTFITLLILSKISICGGCISSIFTLKSVYVDNNIWWAKFELQCLLLIFYYFNSKFKVTCRYGNFECQYNKTHYEEKMSNISNITFVILHFSDQDSLKCHSEYFGIYFSWWNHETHFMSPEKQNLEFGVCQSNTEPTMVP